MRRHSIRTDQRNKHRSWSKPPSSPGAMRRRRRSRAFFLLAIPAAGVLLLFASFLFLHTANGAPIATKQASTGQGNRSQTAVKLAGMYAFQVGQPGPSTQAPDFRLSSTTDGVFKLSAIRGKTALVYFLEGISYQPCWDQMQAIQANWGVFRALGITTMVAITTDPLAALKQKVVDEELIIPVLSDPDLAVSKAYTANLYGMMGPGCDGHSFLVISPSGLIRWRADYGGAPDYTMDLPVPNLLADIQVGLTEKKGNEERMNHEH
ncbi:MAG TPA: redoxin domain-containing protein [Ktedonobacteraceae bacterium]|nr:redoxin domain-containing protein [Ktedonobacteraceae bacterium]